MSQQAQEPTHKGYRMQKFLEERSLPFMRELNSLGRKPTAEDGNAIITKYFGADDLEMLYDLTTHFWLLRDNLLSIMED